ncbi:MAG TPA: MFS transporter [Anaeromyxobacteraceae bacterium]|nr:MFS transporter [Anaeromyxobacteraceae bacterium]
MKNRSALGILFLVVFVDLLGFGMVIPVMALYAKHLGAAEANTGWLSTGFSLMQLGFAPVWGVLSDRIGRRPVLLVSIAMTALAFLGYALAPTFAWLLASRLFAGAATANIAIAQAYVADVTTPEGRARGMGVIGAAFGLGFVFGPAIGGFLSGYDLSWPGFAAAGLSAVNLVGAWLLLPEPAAHSAAGAELKHRLGALWDALTRPGIRRLLVIFFLVVLAFSAMEATYAFLAQEYFGLSNRGVVYAFFCIGVLVVLVQGGLIGPLTRAFGEKRLLVVGAALQAASLVWLPFAHGWLPAGIALPAWLTPGFVELAVASAPLAVGSGLTSPALSSLLSKLGRAEAQGGTLGVGQSASALGRVLGPISGTTSYASTPPSSHAWPYLGGAALMAVSALISLTIRPRNAA